MNLFEDFIRSADPNSLPPLLREFQPTGTVLLTPQRNVSRYAVALLLDETSTPRVVAKVVRGPGDQGFLGAELAVLEHLAQHAAGVPIAPEPLALVRHRDHWILFETALPGVALPRHKLWRSAERLWPLVDAWLRRLPRDDDANTAAQDWIGAQIEQPMSHATNTLKIRDDERRLFDQTERLLRAFAATAAPVPTEHGDITASNFHVSANDQLGAIDWELGYVRGLVGADAVVFLETLFCSGAGGFDNRAAAYAAQFLRSDGGSRRRLREHLLHDGVDPRWLDHVLLATWARRALQVFPRMTSCHLPADLRGNVTARRSALATDMFRTGWPLRLWRLTFDHMADGGAAVIG